MHTSIDLSEDLAAVEAVAIGLAGVEAAHCVGVEDRLLRSGKRVRSRLLLLAARMTGAAPQAIDAAAAVELVHNASLVHDDIVDNCPERRRRPALHVAMGVPAAVLIGDLLYMRALDFLARRGLSEAAHILCNAMQTMVQGELVQQGRMRDLALTFPEYAAIIAAKTASLIAASLEIGCVVGKGDPSQREALREYGLALGAAFQIMDDIGDYERPSSRQGRAAGNDAQQGRVTAPLILAVESASPAERDWVQQAFQRGEKDAAAVAELSVFISGKGGFERARVLAGAAVAEAEERLSCFPNGPAKAALLMFVESLLAGETDTAQVVADAG
jgi:octaprenyl-diphosphate synthase